jgi:hypothetical protein
MPPVFGMAVVNSAFDRMVGMIRMLAMAYETMTEAPVFANASAGKMNKPELIMAPDATQKTSSRPSSFFNLMAQPFQVLTHRLYFIILMYLLPDFTSPICHTGII